MIKLKSVVLVLFLAYALSQTCDNPNPTISNTFLGNIFNKTFGTLNYASTFQQFISNPNLNSLQTYLMAQAPYLITLWCFGGISILLAVAFCLQVCCYNCCRTQKCGNKITLGTYKPSSVSCSIYIFFFFSLLLIALGIATFILASDLVKTSNNTLCSAQNTFNYIYSGTPSGVTPSWSGVNNFHAYANQVSINFPNSVPTINAMFTGPSFSAATSTLNGSLFVAATAPFSCPTTLANQTVTCPFSNINNCPQNSSSQTPVFSQSYCDSTVSTSAAAQIANEQKVNSTAWQNNLIKLSTILSNTSTTSLTFSPLIDSASSLASSIQNFEPVLNNGINLVTNNIHYAEIGTYAVLSFFIFLGLFSFFVVFCVFCSRNFNCRYMLYPLWIIFAFFSIVMFVVSGFLLFGSFTSFDACIAYNYYTHSSSALQSLSFYNSSQFAQILNTCYFTSPTGNIFDTFNQSTNIPVLQQISSSYNNALPAPAFTSVVINIENQLKSYYMNPNNVNLVGSNSSSTPQAALNRANFYASNGGSASCSAVNDTFQYNPTQCYPLLINQNAPNPSCILINSNSNTFVANRQASFISSGCSSSFTTYSNNFNSLLTYGTGIQSLVGSYLNNAGLSSYLTAYFNYYEAVVATMNPQVQAMFNSFLTPLTQLTQGSSCSFITTTLDSFVNTSCNTNFPYIYAISILVIAMACCFFFLMIFSYCLTTRTEFYAFLNGDLQNYKQNSEQLQPVQIQMSQFSNRQQLLLLSK